MSAYIFLSLVDIAFTHGVHLRKVKFRTTLLHDILIKERSAGEAPASSRLVLVLYRCGWIHLYVGEFETDSVGFRSFFFASEALPISVADMPKGIAIAIADSRISFFMLCAGISK